MRITILTISDRASRGAYEDLGGPAIDSWLRRTVTTPMEISRKIISDGFETVRDELIALCDRETVDMVLTTGGTGPSPRDLTPEAMRAVLAKEFPGFGELMRRASLEHVPTAILSRQTAGMKWSRKSGQVAKVYPIDLKGYENGETPEFFGRV